MSSPPQPTSSPNSPLVKRSLDIGFAAIVLLAGAIPLAIAALCIKATSPGPAIFRQIRVGRGGKPFKILKLRTMRQEQGGRSITVSGDSRVTPVGHFLRKTKIDELPQLFNVLKGDMSLVGPRPEVPEYVAKYSESDRQIVLSVAPGLTDFASIRFRNENELLAEQADPIKYYEDVIMPAKLRYYRFYVRHASPCLDFYIVAQTISRLLGDVTMPYRNWVIDRLNRATSETSSDRSI